MQFPAFVKRRQVLLPTLWGLFILLLVVTLTASLIIRQAGHFLAQQAPINGQVLVVEGWLSEPALLLAAKLFRDGNYSLLLTTGGPNTRELNPTYPSFADKAAAFLINQGLEPSQIISLPTPASAQNRTYLSAVIVRDWLANNHPAISTLDLFSSDVHARRSFKLYQMALFDDVQLGIYAAQPSHFSLAQWWTTSDGAKSVITEIIGLSWVYCCFSPGEKNSHQERWGIY